jgi:hypothetical protein
MSTDTQTETRTRTCRCGSTLALLASSKTIWADERIDWLCSDGKPHAPTLGTDASIISDLVDCLLSGRLHEVIAALAEQQPATLAEVREILECLGAGR